MTVVIRIQNYLLLYRNFLTARRLMYLAGISTWNVVAYERMLISTLLRAKAHRVGTVCFASLTILSI